MSTSDIDVRTDLAEQVALSFPSIALGAALSGKLAGYYDWHDEGGYFLVLVLGLAAVAVGAALLAAVEPIRSLMSGVH